MDRPGGWRWNARQTRPARRFWSRCMGFRLRHRATIAAISKLMDGAIRTASTRAAAGRRSEEHTSELQSLMRISYAVFCLKKNTNSTHVLTNHNVYVNI